ncbi:MAG: TRAM domain-containing protein [Oligoflexia bacterium]|nr:TRAM domain-containing protein [Oligoflexia bacterium]
MTQGSEILILQVTDLARGGAGVAREESGRVVFIPFTAPGDRVRARIVEADKRYAQAELLEVLEPSPARVTPKCPAFRRCGGCQWQHLPYELQWQTKARGAKHALARVGVALPALFEEFPAGQVWEYRNRVQLRGFKNELGFYAARSHQIVPLDRCDIARPEINEAWSALRHEGAALAKPYKVEVEVLPDGSTRHAWNARHAAAGFRQVHDAQNEKLRETVGRTLRGGVLLDLFGGAGNLSLPIADRFSEVHCVDLSVPRTRPEGTPANYHFHASPVARWLARDQDRNWAATGEVSAILDPPREGLGGDFNGIADSLSRIGARRLVLVGCDPDAWARDVSRFLGRAWRLEACAVLDLFPQTPHVESVAILTL